MRRLALYMQDFAVLLSEEPQDVHFLKLEPGSTNIVSVVPDEAKTNERLFQAKRGEGDREAIRANNRISRRIREDRTTGSVKAPTGLEIIRWAPLEREEPIRLLGQQGSLDGIPITIGGKNDLVSVHLEAPDKTLYICHAKRELARGIGKCLFETEIRAFGSGTWVRSNDGNWNLERFTITNFETLNNQPLSSVVAKLRSITGSQWASLPDPWTELEAIRKGSDKDEE